MDNFTIIYKILKALEKALDFDELDKEALSPEALGITPQRWVGLLEMLFNDGYIDGLTIIQNIGGRSLRIDRLRITLKGLEYLSDNSLMAKAARLAKGIKDVLPI